MKKLTRNLALFLAMFALPLAAGCGDDVGHDDHGHDHDGHDHDPNEVMTTVQLSFAPAGGGETFTASWADPEQDGSPVVDDIKLVNGETYTVTMTVLNELEDPVEDLTAELVEEMDEHQVFFTGPAVQSPAQQDNPEALVDQEYADMDSNGYPIGYVSTFTAKAAGSSTLSLMLRHLPPINGNAVKTGDLAEIVNSGSATDLPGSSDINVEFTVIVE